MVTPVSTPTNNDSIIEVSIRKWNALHQAGSANSRKEIFHSYYIYICMMCVCVWVCCVFASTILVLLWFFISALITLSRLCCTDKLLLYVQFVLDARPYDACINKILIWQNDRRECELAIWHHRHSLRFSALMHIARESVRMKSDSLPAAMSAEWGHPFATSYEE